MTLNWWSLKWWRCSEKKERKEWKKRRVKWISKNHENKGKILGNKKKTNGRGIRRSKQTITRIWSYVYEEGQWWKGKKIVNSRKRWNFRNSEVRWQILLETHIQISCYRAGIPLTNGDHHPSQLRQKTTTNLLWRIVEEKDWKKRTYKLNMWKKEFFF